MRARDGIRIPLGRIFPLARGSRQSPVHDDFFAEDLAATTRYFPLKGGNIKRSTCFRSGTKNCCSPLSETPPPMTTTSGEVSVSVCAMAQPSVCRCAIHDRYGQGIASGRCFGDHPRAELLWIALQVVRSC